MHAYSAHTAGGQGDGKLGSQCASHEPIRSSGRVLFFPIGQNAIDALLASGDRIVVAAEFISAFAVDDSHTWQRSPCSSPFSPSKSAMVKASFFEVMAVCVALMAALAATHARSEHRKRQKFALQQPLVSTKSELELVKDIVYINNSTEPGASFRLERSRHLLNEEGNQILVVGVCGGSGSGKTTLSRAIMTEFGADRVSYLSHDYYYKDLAHLTMEQRAKHNFDHPDALETDLMVKHLKQLRAGKTVDVPVYDFSTHSRCKATTPMKPNSVILVEGILIFADQALADLMDIKIFVETAADIRLVRRMHRDMEERGRTAESVMDQYMKTVRPMHMMFVEQSKRVADIIIPHGVNSVALDMIISRLHSFTAGHSLTGSSRSGSERSDSIDDDDKAPSA